MLVHLTEYEPLVTHELANPMGAQVIPLQNDMGHNAVSGAWQNVLTTPLSADHHLIEIFASGVAVNGQAKNALLDFGWDPAGGTNYGATAETRIPYLNVGYAGSSPVLGVSFLLPLLIPGGATLGARGQTSHATVGSIYVWAMLHKAKNRRLARFGTQVLSFGEQTTLSRGKDVTFSTAAEGAWTLVTTVPADPPSWWLAASCHNNITALSADYPFSTELSFGPNSTDIKSAGERWFESIVGTGEARCARSRAVFCRPNAGQDIYVRGRAASATAYTTMVHGVR